ncbi:MAG: phosphopyruvate hydratase [Candidatus Micrarchaeia archaeon]
MIKDISLHVALDSRGRETIAAYLKDEKGNEAIAIAPSGTSRSGYEAVPLPRGGAKEAIKLFSTYKAKLLGMDAEQQKEIDATLHEIDATENFARIGGNAATAISIATAKLAAKEQGLELYQYIYRRFTQSMGIKKAIPFLLGNILGGGVHSNSNMQIQEILITNRSKDVIENAKTNIMLHNALGEFLRKRDLAIGLNIENAWISKLADIEAIKAVEKTADGLARLGFDFAATEYFSNGKYLFYDRHGKRRQLTRAEYFDAINEIVEKHRPVYIEDPFEESELESFARLTKEFGRSALIVGDDLYATNAKRLEEGIKARATNGILVKVNQVGTLTDTLEVVKLARRHGIKLVVSHRSGETIDAFISHLAVAFGAAYIKCGILGGERIAKINELARIQELENSTGRDRRRKR